MTSCRGAWPVAAGTYAAAAVADRSSESDRGNGPAMATAVESSNCGYSIGAGGETNPPACANGSRGGGAGSKAGSTAAGTGGESRAAVEKLLALTE